MPPDGFFGIHILQNSISAGAAPWTPLGMFTTLPRPYSLLGEGCFFLIFHPFSDLISTPLALSMTGPPTFQMLPPPMGEVIIRYWEYYQCKVIITTEYCILLC